MFYVLYEFDVKPHQENQFKEVWHEFTIKIKHEQGALGSRLHRVINSEHKWLAYSSWPNKETWQNARIFYGNDDLKKSLNKTCRDMKMVYELELIDDLLPDLSKA